MSSTVLGLCLGWGAGLPAVAGPGSGQAAGQDAPCPGPVPAWQRLAPGVWWWPAAVGDSQPDNRGRVSNLLLVREGRGPGARLWALGSGPSPAMGRALGCHARRLAGLPVTDVVSPWARPELVLGVQGLRAGQPALRHWAHASVAQAMAEQCAHCVQRLRQRLQDAASDLGDDPVHLPDHLLHGDAGRLGPFDWWRLPRAPGRWLTVWRLRGHALGLAHGLLQGEGVPDGRDADLALLQQAAERLATLGAADAQARGGADAQAPGGADARAPGGTGRPALRWLGEQGPPLPPGAPAWHARYWAWLRDGARAQVRAGGDEAAPAPPLPAALQAPWLAPHGPTAAWHGLNWQRAWRQAEADELAAPGPPVPERPVLPP